MRGLAQALYVFCQLQVLFADVPMIQRGNHVEILDSGYGYLFFSGTRGAYVRVCYTHHPTAPSGAGIVFCWQSKNGTVQKNEHCDPGYCSFQTSLASNRSTELWFGDPKNTHGLHHGLTWKEPSCVTIRVHSDMVVYEQYYDECDLHIGWFNELRFKIHMVTGSFDDDNIAVFVSNVHTKDVWVVRLVLYFIGMSAMVAMFAFIIWYYACKASKLVEQGYPSREFPTYVLNKIGLDYLPKAEKKRLYAIFKANEEEAKRKKREEQAKEV